MPFQVVELRLDAEDQVIDRRAIPIPSAPKPTRAIGNGTFSQQFGTAYSGQSESS
jgi:hypothetical protein